RVLLEGDPTTLVLTDALGRELETATPALLAETSHADGTTYDTVMASMRAEAMRIARGTEEAIDQVLQGLDAQEIVSAEAELAEDLAPNEDETHNNEPDTVEDPGEEPATLEAEATAPDAIDDQVEEDDLDVPAVGAAVATLANAVNGGNSEGSTPASTDENPAEMQETAVAAEVPDSVETEPAPLEPIAASAPSSETASEVPEIAATPSADPEPVEQPSQPAPAQQVSAPMAFGTGGGFTDLSKYKKPAPAEEAPAVEAAPEAPGPVSQNNVSPASEMPTDVRSLLDGVIAAPGDEPTAEVEATAAATPKPGESLSLSGLTSGLGVGAVGHRPTLGHGGPDIVTDPETPVTADPIAPPADQAAPPATGDLTPPPAPAGPVEQAAEAPDQTDPPVEDDAEKPKNSRFNPWI
ncbi:MAG: hypothetical protein AAGJ50_04520, partial [Pseudomonadota bacterium]